MPPLTFAQSRATVTLGCLEVVVVGPTDSVLIKPVIGGKKILPEKKIYLTLANLKNCLTGNELNRKLENCFVEQTESSSSPTKKSTELLGQTMESIE